MRPQPDAWQVRGAPGEVFAQEVAQLATVLLAIVTIVSPTTMAVFALAGSLIAVTAVDPRKAAVAGAATTLTVILVVGWPTLTDWHLTFIRELTAPLRDAGLSTLMGDGFDATLAVARRRWPAWLAAQAWLSVPAGVLLAGLVRWRAEGAPQKPFDPTDRVQVRRRARDERRIHRRATRRARRAPDTTARVGRNRDADGVLGAYVSGDLPGWRRANWLVVHESKLPLGSVVVGLPGSGKTETLLRLAWIALGHGWNVHFIDAKADPTTRDRFLVMAEQAGVEIGEVRLFPECAFDGWRGDPTAVRNRLMAVIDYTETYYRDGTHVLLDLALRCPDLPPPTSMGDLLARLSVDVLRARWGGDGVEEAAIAALDPRTVTGAFTRYRAFQTAVDGKLDGRWSWEDAAASYTAIDGVALGAEAAALGRFLLEDFGHYAARRKPNATKSLLIVDEFSALRAPHAAELVERLRAFNASLVVAGQSLEGLHDDDRVVQRLLNTVAGPLIVHRTADPEDLAMRAGTITRPETSHVIDTTGPTGLGSYRLQDTFRVSPDHLRTLATGHAVVIAEGRAATIAVAQAPIEERRLIIETPQERLERAARASQRQLPEHGLDAPEPTPDRQRPRMETRPARQPEAIAPQPELEPDVGDLDAPSLDDLFDEGAGP